VKKTRSIVLVAVAMVLEAGAVQAGVERPRAEDVKALATKVADWQISGSKNKDASKRDLSWRLAALYSGMDHFRHIADQPEKYTDWLVGIGERYDWKLIDSDHLYNADDHAVGQFYLSLYEQFKNPSMLKAVQERCDWILANPKTGSLRWGKNNDARTRWGWADALFMAPPVWARLAKVTGESKYLDFMDREYHASYDLLWNQDDRFFWRDSSYMEKREANGKNIYWSRGNGWVFGGLAFVISDLPADWNGRSFYIDLFRQMAESVKNCQREDGTWSMGLLGGIEAYPTKETSGTSFLTFGLAWGVNNGLLDRATYEPVVFKAWDALAGCVTDEGKLGYVQPVGSAPGEADAEKSGTFGVGAFLAASAEVYKLAGGSK
jgi:unsaturated rhamnogalacturonyl hydrolase